ncbi:SusC/RagA family TonB-linked outer membrane protein [Namhaeicola litoreus]|uniref:SusC/RagA family TonB-linked outer membrane protein n=1 Tax=Namhaeicola litoreus TaxID=1052145 RepID=A0ABW3Y4H1_9FLAO
MKTRFNGILTLIFALLVHISYAQEKTVSGNVSDESGPLPGVSVIVDGTTMGTETDFDGNYSISVKQGDVLRFSFIGMTSETRTVGLENVINVAMVSGQNTLDEVVVTAFGLTREKKSLGYATQEVKTDELAKNPANNVNNALAGRIAGIQVKGANGTIGGSTRVLIRGVNSISGDNRPLYVIDGTPIQNSNFNSVSTQRSQGGIDYGDLSADINQDDIESINVLKGPAASALYGSRGANGVIMITTKKGKANRTTVELNTSLTFDNVYVLPEYQNEYGGGYSQTFSTFDFDPSRHPAEWAAFQGQKIPNYGADESWGPKLDGTLVRHWDSWLPGDPSFGELRPWTANPDNVRDFYETGITQNYNAAISGGTEGTQYRLSMGRTDEDGIMPNSSRKVNSISLNGTHKINDKFTTSASINYIYTKIKGRPTVGYDFSNGKNVAVSFNQWFQRQVDMNRLQRKYKSPTGVAQSWNIRSPTDTRPNYWDNPYWIVNESFTEDVRDRVYGNVNLTYNLTDHLTMSVIGRTDFYTFTAEDRTASGSLATEYYSEYVRQGREDNFEFLTTYNNSFNDFDVTVNFQANNRTNKYKNNGGETVGGFTVPDFYNLNASLDRPNITDYKEKKIINSLTAFGSFGYKGMLYLDWSARNDWSSTLPDGENSYFYPAVSGSFVFSELLPNDIFSFGKVRAGWAKIGNDTGPYQLYNTYDSGTPVGGDPTFSVPNNSNNPLLKPENIESWEIGLETAFFQNRLSFDLTYYNKVSTDLILPISVSGTSGFTSVWVNAGEMTNEGWELAASVTPIRTDNFNWNIGFNWATNKNEVVELVEGVDNYQITSYGRSINARVGETYGLMAGSGFTYDENGTQIFQQLANGNIETVRTSSKTIGSTMPDYTGGVINSFTFGNFSINALVDFSQGGDIYSMSQRWGTNSGLIKETAGLNDKGNPKRDPVSEGGGVHIVGVDPNGNPIDGYTDAQQWYGHLANRDEAFVYDASFVKLREASITYRLDRKLLENAKISDVSFSVIGRNLWLIHSNVPNIDPDAALGSGNIQGMESGQIPSTRSIGFNVNLKF